MTLRGLVVVLGLLLLALAVALLVIGRATPLAIYLAVVGLVLIAAVLFERWRYRPPVASDQAHWQPTGERFVDPTSGHLIEVRYNPTTGERDYVDRGPAQ